MAIDFFNTGSSLQGQFNQMNQIKPQEDIYNFLGKKFDLTDEGVYDLTNNLGEKENVNKLFSGIRDYFGTDQEEGFNEKMLNNPTFIMGLSLLKSATEGKNVGGALLPAAETTQAYMTNQELRKNNKRLMRMKEGQLVLDTVSAQQGVASKVQEMESRDIQNQINIENLNNILDEKERRKQTFAIIDSNDNLNVTEKEYQKNNWKNYGKVDDYSKYESTPDVYKQVENKIKIKETALESWIPFYGSGADKEAARTQILKDISGKATAIALEDYRNGNRNTPEVQDKDINKARDQYIADGKIKKPNWFLRLIGLDSSVFGTNYTLSGKRMGGEVEANEPVIIGEDGPEIFVPETDGNIISNPKTAGGYTWEDAIIDSSEMLKKIKQSSGAEEAKKALKKFRPDLYI